MRTRARLAAVTAGGIALATALAGTGTVPANAATGPAVPQYTLTLGAPNQTYLAINSHGDILGEGVQPNGIFAGFILPAGSSTPEWLSESPGNNDRDQEGAASLNDLDQAAGSMEPESTQIARPLFWTGGNTIGVDLGVNPGRNAIAIALNDNGQIVGANSSGAPNFTQTPWLDHNGQVTNLPTFTGSGTPNAINNTGLIVGSAATAGGKKVAVAWQNGTIKSLGVLPDGGSSEALAVNQNGVAVGDATDSCTDATIFDHGTVTPLPLNPAGECDGYPPQADAINDSGTVVGVDGVLQPFVYQNGVATEIQDLLPAGSTFVPDSATGINDAGVIVGTGDINISGVFTRFGYTLTPVRTGS